jgi:anti-sigma B factor antagonist
MSEEPGPRTRVPEHLVLDVRITDEGNGSVVLTVAGELDTLSTPILRRALDTVWADRPDHVLIDVSSVTFLSASGLHALRRAVTRAAAHRASLEVHAAPGHVSRLLSWVQLPHSTGEAGSRRPCSAALHAVPDPAPLPDVVVPERAAERRRPQEVSSSARSVDAVARRLAELFAGLPGPARVAASWDRRLLRARVTRDVMGQATGILMERNTMTAQEALRCLDAVSRLRDVPVPVVAEKLARTGEW